MTKIKVVLDQETWVAVDVPEEFQAIVASFCSHEESLADNEPFSNNHSEQLIVLDSVSQDPSNSSEMNILSDTKKIVPRLSSSGSIQENRVRSAPHRNTDGKITDAGRSSSQILVYAGVGYQMVNYDLILLKMLSAYVDISKSLPVFSSGVIHRVVEILKMFNTRTCRLVLCVRRVRFLKIPDSRKGLLLSEIERVAQDYKVHRDEIHSKLVQIVSDRLLINLQKLPQNVEN